MLANLTCLAGILDGVADGSLQLLLSNATTITASTCQRAHSAMSALHPRAASEARDRKRAATERRENQ